MQGNACTCTQHAAERERMRTSRHVRGLKKAEEVSQAVLLDGMHGSVASCRRVDLRGGCRLAALPGGDLRCVLHLVSAAQAVDVCERQT